MGGGAGNQFSAASSALGYHTQLEYGLLMALQRLNTEATFKLSFETLDDIVFEPKSSPTELWQTKHHISHRGSLGNASPDLWKTLSNWIQVDNGELVCFLLTTDTAPHGSAAARLHPNRNSDDVKEAVNILNEVATNSANTKLSRYYANYLSLDETKRLDLLSKVSTIDGALKAETITDCLVMAVRLSVLPRYRIPLVERLRGWWHGRVISHLQQIASGTPDWIDAIELEEQILLIAQSLRDDNLPLDFTLEEKPSQNIVDNDKRIFVEQMRLINLPSMHIIRAVHDHNRAFAQRSRWQREDLLGINELIEYDEILIEEWERLSLPTDNMSDPRLLSSEEKCASARALYTMIQNRQLPPIRPLVRAQYISFGSLHMLADNMKIGWHPDWQKHFAFDSIEKTKDDTEVEE